MTAPEFALLRIDAQPSEHGVTAWVSGEIDITNAHDLRQNLVGHFVEGARHLVVDLSAVTFIDSVGLGALVAVQREATIHGAQLTLAEPHRRVVAILKLSRLDSVLAVHSQQLQGAS